MVILVWVIQSSDCRGTDLINAGARWHDKEVVVDGNLITSRTPADLPIFCSELLKALSLVEV